MTKPLPRPATRGLEPAITRTIVEAASVIVVGLLLALAANSLSPRGLSLGRDYFPRATAPAADATGLHPAPSRDDETAAGNEAAVAGKPGTQAVQARLEARGFRFVTGEEARQLFEDPRRAQELVVFLDARNDEHFAKGHVPGAYQFDHYYPQHYLPVILPVCQLAELIVIYCSGGDCEDSEFAAVALRDMGIPGERLAVYGGGMADWQARGMPVEVGPRGSGQPEGNPP